MMTLLNLSKTCEKQTQVRGTYPQWCDDRQLFVEMVSPLNGACVVA